MFLLWMVILLIRKDFSWLKNIFRNRIILITLTVTASFLAINWLTYIWAINNNLLLEASLGYFICPLVNVLLGVIILKEKLRIWQLIAVSIAFFGVLYLTFYYGSFPWIGLHHH